MGDSGRQCLSPKCGSTILRKCQFDRIRRNGIRFYLCDLGPTVMQLLLEGFNFRNDSPYKLNALLSWHQMS